MRWEDRPGTSIREDGAKVGEFVIDGKVEVVRVSGQLETAMRVDRPGSPLTPANKQKTQSTGI